MSAANHILNCPACSLSVGMLLAISVVAMVGFAHQLRSRGSR